jgi:hypothetical protein
VQVDPIKPTLKAPGTKRLKLEYDELLSMFGFKFDLRRYTKESGERRRLAITSAGSSGAPAPDAALRPLIRSSGAVAGAYTRSR